MSLFFPVTQGGDYVLFASDDFTQWSAVDTNTAAGNIVDFIDRDAPRFPHRFYFMSQPTVTLSATAGVGSGGSGVEGSQALSLRVPGPGVYAVEASADLKTWSVVGEVTSQTGKIEMPVSHLHEPKMRFFRIQTQ